MVLHSLNKLFEVIVDATQPLLNPLAVNEFLVLNPFIRIIQDRNIRPPSLTENISMLAVRPLHIPVEWPLGGE
jgi:hypothetical protein